jgi:TolB-like protein
VLPFANLSSDPEQEFFSDGMTEEITSALARVADLRVVGRTSAFQFKGQNQDLRAIGQALSATHLIEGSVRKDGNEVRITAQLIRADDGTHLWTESYNRELKGVFAMQEEIATAIASALRVPLGLKGGQSLVANRTSDTDSYQDYLRARALVRGRGPLEPGGPLTEAAKLLEQVVARDPNFAPAWGLLGYSYLLIPSFTTAVTKGSADEFRLIAADAYSKAEAAAQQAVRLDPNNVGGYTILALVLESRGALVQAEDLFKRVLSLDPNDADALHQYGGMLALVGRLKDSLPMRMRLRAQEPLVPIFNTFTALVLYANGRNDEATAILEASPPGLFARLFLAQIYSSMGRYSEAADALLEAPSGMVLPGALEEAARVLRTAPAKASSTQTGWSSGFLGFVYLYVGVPDRALGWIESFVEAGYPIPGNGIAAIWTVSYAPVRKTERFKDYVRKIGLVDYWRARGWSDLCRPVGADDFVCD